MTAKMFRINTQEIHDVITEVQAETLEDAIKKVREGEGDRLIVEYNRLYHSFEPEEAPE